MIPHIDNWLQRLIEEIFAAEEKSFQNQINLLVDENNKVRFLVDSGFNYLGKNYGKYGGILPNQPTLATELHPKMQRLVHFRDTVRYDRKYITQVFSRLVRPCNSVEELRNVLPDCVVINDWSLSKFPRTREPAYTAANDSLLMRQYLKILPKVETYCAMRLLY
jgi:hypothetical protein